METLGDAYPKEQARVREVLALYRELGPGGQFGAAMIERDLKEADEAAISGDLPRMVRAFNDLKGWEA